VQIDDGVGVLLPIGADFVCAALGAMMAGAAYVPLSPASPSARLSREIGEAGITCIVTGTTCRKTADGLADVPIVLVDRVTPAEPARVFGAAQPDQCAYRIFTSGSTGGMKAVEIAHRSLANLAAFYRDRLPLTETDAMTALASTTFDASVADIWPILSTGGTLLIPPERILIDLPGLVDWLAQSGATCAFLPTAISERLFRQEWPATIALRTLLTGGDTLHQRPPPGLPFRVINTYGPTENTVDSLWAEIGPVGGRPVIGRPIAGVWASVVDADRNPVRASEPGELPLGELVLGGVQLARGYRNRPDLDAPRFAETAEGRVYYTGDLVRLDAAGDFEFHGRIDNQVQVLGVRVEPGEIEALLKGDPRVRDAACLPIRAGTEVTGLAAHVSPRDAIAPAADLAEALHALLAGHLPPAIMPKAITIHAALPYTAAGKLDRKALARNHAAPDIVAAKGPDAAADPLGAMWQAALPNRADPATPGKFWDLGGDSLAAIELLLRIEEALGVQVPVGVFLEDPSLAGLRRAVAQRHKPVISRLSSGSGCPIVLWYTLGGDLETYQSLLPLLRGRTVIGIMSPALSDPDYAPMSLEQAVADSLVALHAFGVKPPFAHVGFSSGGLMAFEAERQLERQGTVAPFMALAGTFPPLKSHDLWTTITTFARWAPGGLIARLRNRETRKSLHFWKSAAARMPGFADPIRQRNYTLSLAYRPASPIATKLVYFREEVGPVADRRRPYFYRPDRGWHEWLTTAPTVHQIDTDHSGLMSGESARMMAVVINALLDQAASSR
jgi:amino acid adenylation domain-containing protein